MPDQRSGAALRRRHGTLFKDMEPKGIFLENHPAKILHLVSRESFCLGIRNTCIRIFIYMYINMYMHTYIHVCWSNGVNGFDCCLFGCMYAVHVYWYVEICVHREAPRRTMGGLFLLWYVNTLSRVLSNSFSLSPFRRILEFVPLTPTARHRNPQDTQTQTHDTETHTKRHTDTQTRRHHK